MIVIGVINDAGATGKKLILLWVNFLSQIFPIKFLQSTDRIYFENLINFLKGNNISKRMYFFLNILSLRKRVLIIEIDPNNLFKEDIKINEDRISLIESKALIYLSNISLTHPNDIIRLVLKKKGRRRLLKKVVKEPFGLVINQEAILTPTFLRFLKDRFKKYEIFRVEIPLTRNSLELNDDIYIRPITWIFNKLFRISLSFR